MKNPVKGLISGAYRVLGISHDLTPTRWLVTLGLTKEAA